MGLFQRQSNCYPVSYSGGELNGNDIPAPGGPIPGQVIEPNHGNPFSDDLSTIQRTSAASRSLRR